METEVSIFTPDKESICQAPAVYSSIRNDDECTREIFTLIVRDYISAPAMDQNLIPPFSMREVGFNVRTVPKFQVEDSSIDDHSSCFPEESLRTLLTLCGLFSYFLLKIRQLKC